jgi:Tol biopolymer transport system component
VALAIAKYGEEKPDLWLLDPKRTGGVQLTFRGAIRPVWTRDGRSLVFDNYDFALPMRTGVGNGLYRLTLGVPGVQALGRGEPVLAYPHEVTRDARTLVGMTVAVIPTIVAIDMETGASRTLVQDEHGVVQPRVSPDGKWIAYTVLLPNRAEVYVEPLAGGTRTQLSVDGGIAPVWRDDGRELYYQGFDEMLMRVGLQESGGQMNAAGVEPLFRVRTGGLRSDWATDVAAAAHGQKFLVNTILGDSDNVPIEITMNWPELLKGTAG